MRRLLVLLLVVLVLAVVADRVGASLASRAVAVSIQRSENLAARPDVSIGGFPFLTQLARGRYDDVHVVISDVAATDAVTVRTVDVHLRGVHLDAGDALRRKVSEIPVDAGTLTASADYSALDAAVDARLPGTLRVTFGADSGDSVRTSLTFAGLGTPITLSGLVGISLRGQALHVQLLPDSLTGEGGSLLDAARGTLATLLSVTVPLPSLPFGATVDAATAGGSGVTVTASARDLVLRQR